MTPYEFGRFVKLALDPKPTMVAEQAPGLTGLVGGKLTKIKPQYEEYSPPAAVRQQEYSNRANGLYDAASDAYYAHSRNQRQIRNGKNIIAAAPAAGSVAGALTGQQALGTMGGMAGSYIGNVLAMEGQENEPWRAARMAETRKNYEKHVPAKRIESNGYNSGHTSSSLPWNSPK